MLSSRTQLQGLDMGTFRHFKKYKHQLVSALQFYYGAKTMYNIHSPFLFKFIPTLFDYSAAAQEHFNSIISLTDKLIIDKEEFVHTDFGEGSRSIKRNSKKRVKNILKTSSSNSKKGKFLYKTIQYFKPADTLELGTNLGIGSAYMALAFRDNKIISVEGDKFLGEKSRQNFESLKIKNVEVIIEQFDNFLFDQNTDKKFDLTFIDGNHGYEATVRYFNKLYDPQIENQVIIIDDIYWSEGMTEAWKHIQLKLVSGYCLDLFNIGIIVNSKAKADVVKLKYIRRRWKPFSFGFWG